MPDSKGEGAKAPPRPAACEPKPADGAVVGAAQPLTGADLARYQAFIRELEASGEIDPAKA